VSCGTVHDPLQPLAQPTVPQQIDRARLAHARSQPSVQQPGSWAHTALQHADSSQPGVSAWAVKQLPTQGQFQSGSCFVHRLSARLVQLPSQRFVQQSGSKEHTALQQ
jgi:hypothetical protein